MTDDDLTVDPQMILEKLRRTPIGEAMVRAAYWETIAEHLAAENQRLTSAKDGPAA